jgi:hypothetical protein
VEEVTEGVEELALEEGLISDRNLSAALVDCRVKLSM